MERPLGTPKKLLFLGAICLFLLISAEIGLRVTTPASEFLTGDARHQVWFLEHLDALRAKDPNRAKIESDPQRGWRLKSNLTIGNETTNSHGVRGSKEYSYERTPGVARAVVLGDSFTYGVGVGDDETYPHSLEEFLKDHEFVNLGVAGYGTDQQLVSWHEEGKKYQPDLVVLGYYIPDFHRNVQSWWGASPRRPFQLVDDKLVPAEMEYRPLEDLDGNAEIIQKKVAHLLWTPRVWLAMKLLLQRVINRTSPYRESEESFLAKLALSRAILMELRDSCAEEKVPLTVMLFDSTDHPASLETARALEEIGKELGIDVLRLDASLGLRDRSGAGMILDPDTRHWSAFGHRRAAELLLAHLIEKGIVAPRL